MGDITLNAVTNTITFNYRVPEEYRSGNKKYTGFSTGGALER